MRNVGFDVVEGTNLTRDKMTEKLLDFGKRADGADVALFFYAGHGIAVNGTNYLLPIDADLKSEMDVKLGGAINVDLTLDQTMADAKVKLVFLDACRDNPFAAKIRSARATRSVSVQSGLAEMKSGEGTLIAFATGPGQTALDGETGTNSPFTRALMANIAAPGVEIQQAMTQVRAQVNEETSKNQLPWGHTNLTGSVYLNPVAGTVGRRGDREYAGGGRRFHFRSRTRVLALDQGLQQAGRAQRLSDQLSQRPVQVVGAGPHRLAAGRPVDHDPQPDHRHRSGHVHRGSRPVGRGSARFRPDPAPRRAAPPHGLGFDTKVSGKFDDSTRAVIMRWQAARGYPQSGFLNTLQLKALQSEISATKTASADDGDDEPSRHARHHGGGGGRHYRGAGGPGAFFGGMMGGLFGRR